MSKDYAKQFGTESNKRLRFSLPIWVIPVTIILLIVLGLYFWHWQRQQNLWAAVAADAAQTDNQNDAGSNLNFEFYSVLSQDSETSLKPTDNKAAPVTAVVPAEPATKTKSTSAKTSSNNNAVPVDAVVPAAPADTVKPTPAPPASPQASTSGKYNLQLAVFQDRKQADAYKNQLGNVGAPLSVVKDKVNDKTVYRVLAGPFADLKSAQTLQTKLSKSKIKSIVKKI